MNDCQTICPGCSLGCRITLQHEDGQVKHIFPSGDSENGNLLCDPASLLPLFSDTQPRITQPMVRNSLTGGFVPVDWDEALETAASGLLYMQAAAPDGIAGVAGPCCTNEAYYLFQKMMRLCLGTNRLSSLGAAANALTGVATNALSDMAEHADLIFLLSCDPDQTHPVAGMLIRQALARGAKLIVAGDAGALNGHAALHLPLTAGAEVAFANGLMQQILEQELMHNQIFAEGFGGFHAVRKVVQQYTPDRVQSLCGVSPDAMAQAAQLYTAPGRACILCPSLPGMEAILNLAIMADKLGKPGCGVIPLPPTPNAQGAVDMGMLPELLPGMQEIRRAGIRKQFETLWNAAIPADLPDAAGPDPTQVLYVLDAEIEVPEQVRFLIYQGPYLNQTAQRADVLLPSPAFAEQDGTLTNAERRVQKLHPAFPQAEGVPSATEVLAMMMRALGYPQDAQSAAEVLSEISDAVPLYGGITPERLEHDSLQWPCPDTRHPGTPVLYLGKFSRGLGWFRPVEYGAGGAGLKITFLEPLGLSAEALRQRAAQALKGQAEITCFADRTTDLPTLIERARGSDILVLSNLPCPRALLEACPNLKLVCVAFTGTDHVDLDYCRAHHITVCNCAGYATDAVAELVLGLTLQLLRFLPACDRAARSGGTNEALCGQELSGKTFGIVGFGAIGSRVASIAQAFGCRVLAYSRTQKQAPHVEFTDLDTLLRESDIVSLHVPYTEQTRHLIDEAALRKMKPTALLINCARGAVVDSQALADALARGDLAGAGLDVLEQEPPFSPDHPLLHAPHVVLAPHVGFYTQQAMERRVGMVLDQLLAYLSGNLKTKIC
ncbi:MAG: molybdopterin-dependent oxidoreductase [Clostridiales bacterium]|nr:molybdopterin-dependent oxidoreductase [Clostridiales bacterium]